MILTDLCQEEDPVTLRRKAIQLASGIFLGGFLLLAVGSPALADRDYGPSCRDRLNADKARIDRDAHRYGEHSPKVDHDIDRMEADRNWCRSHHADWDHSLFDIGIYVKK